MEEIIERKLYHGTQFVVMAIISWISLRLTKYEKNTHKLANIRPFLKQRPGSTHDGVDKNSAHMSWYVFIFITFYHSICNKLLFYGYLVYHVNLLIYKISFIVKIIKIHLCNQVLIDFLIDCRLR